MTTLPRYMPDRLLPRQAYLPGKTPRTNEPNRLHTSEFAPQRGPFVPLDWRLCQDYLWGVDLYNYGFPWEAHEAWESVWRIAASGCPARALLQGLIQCAATVIKARTGRLAALSTLSARADVNLSRVICAVGAYFMGMDVVAFRAAFRTYAAARPNSVTEWPRIELIALHTVTA